MSDTAETLNQKMAAPVRKVFEALGVKLMSMHELSYKMEKAIPESYQGCYWADEDTIILKDSRSETGDLNTVALHELLHWTGHYTRLSRAAIQLSCPDRFSFSYHTEEAAAQLGMHKLAKWLGVSEENIDYYLNNYLEAYPFADLHIAEMQAEQAVRWIKEAYSKSLRQSESASALKCA